MQHSVHRKSICRIQYIGRIYAGLSTWEEYMQDSVHRNSICSIQYIGRVYAGLSTWEE
jgi:hypothetical protein